MKLHNTLTRSVDEFTPLTSDTVTMYSCGPTVYDTPHVGNWSAYIRWDVLARTLRADNYKLQWYMNITDVGHLVSDGDEGEDKLEKGARREGKTAWEVADYYSKIFSNGLDALNISIDHRNLTKATDHIAEQIALVAELEKKGYTYTIDDGVYFDSTQFLDYGKMARLNLDGQQDGKRIELGQKRHGSDFALWKFSPANESRDMEWNSPWGRGFPGWHIECSAMAMKYLGNTIDIHTGGIDHIPVHHTNEIAQSEAATNSQFVRFWVHGNFLQVDGVKISKSIGNVHTLEDIIARGFLYEDFRMLVLQSHYRTEANFTWDGMRAAQNRRKSIQAFADLRFQPVHSTFEPIDFSEVTSQMVAHLKNDLNTPRALEVIGSVIDRRPNGIMHSELPEFTAFVDTIGDLLGIEFGVSPTITSTQNQLIIERQSARDNKDWAASDAARDTLLTENIAIRDTPDGPIWYRV